jgi:uroporphyrin-III C-methyltransferase
MDDSNPTVPAPQPEKRVSAGGGFVKWFFALVLVGVVAYLLWWTMLGSGAPTRAAGEEQRLASRIDALEHGLAQLRGNADTLRSRLDDGDKVDHSMREQLLSMGERTRLLEDALANLSDKRLSGHDTLALDEAELLLTIGGERFALFHDSAAAITAYRLADNVLGEVQDTAYASVRQGVAAEIAALSALQSVDSAALSSQLGQLAAQAAQLPIGEAHAPAAAPADESRMAHVFAMFVQVHHDDSAAAPVLARDTTLARELILVDLHRAQAAALARDTAAYRDAMTEARAQLAAAFDAQVPEVGAVLARFDSLVSIELEPASPPVIGTALRELHTLRASHALHAAATDDARPEGVQK